MKAKTLLTLLLCALCTFGAAATKKAATVTRTYRATPFKQLDVNNGIRVIYTTGAYADFQAQGPAELMEYLICRVEKGTLELKFSPSKPYNLNSSGVVVRITAPAVGEIEANGGASVLLKNAYSVSGDLDVEVNGGASFTSQSTINARKFSVEANGGAQATIKGTVTADKADFESNGGAAIDSSAPINVRDINIESNGGARVELTAISAGNLEAESNGGAQITVGGKASVASLEANAGAGINARGLSVDRYTSIDSAFGSKISTSR